MKHVQKAGPPHEYRRWCRQVDGTNKEDYREMPTDVKAVVLAALVREQGQICAYTMKRIDADTSHIEHIKPEIVCRNEETGLDLDFSNMVSCFPRDGMRRAYRYGAQKKADWWEPTLFVSPLQSSCEKRFRFSIDGKISVVGTNEAAKETIKVLALDHTILTEDRRRAVHEVLYGADGTDALSRAKASQLRRDVCKKSCGQFIEFCIAIKDALDEYLKYLEKLSQKRKSARRGAG